MYVSQLSYLFPKILSTQPIPEHQRMNRMMEKEWRSHQSTLHCETAMITIVANARRRQTNGEMLNNNKSRQWHRNCH